MLQLSGQGFARAAPILFLSLKSQQNVLRFFMLRLQSKSLFRQGQGRIRITSSQFLAHNSTYTHKAGLIILQKLFVNLVRFFGITNHLCRLRGDQICKLGFT